MSENDKKVWVGGHYKMFSNGTIRKWIKGYWRHLPEKGHK